MGPVGRAGVMTILTLVMFCFGGWRAAGAKFLGFAARYMHFYMDLRRLVRRRVKTQRRAPDGIIPQILESTRGACTQSTILALCVKFICGAPHKSITCTLTGPRQALRARLGPGNLRTL